MADEGELPDVLSWLGVRVDLRRRVVSRAGEADRALTTLERDLLAWLAAQGERVVSRDELLREVWGHAEAVVSRACDNAIQRLRAKLEADPAHPALLVTVHGGGYQLRRPAPEAAPRPVSGFAAGDRTVDLRRGCVHGPDGEVALTAREIDLLEHLRRAGGASVDRDALQRAVWGSAAGRALEHTVSRLRRKLEGDPTAPTVLVTTARGYRLDTGAPVPTSPPMPGAPALPEEPDRRIGRDDVVRDLARSLDEARLITLLGLGGAGKTRTALACARALAADGCAVFWADLARAPDADALWHVVARAVGVDLSARDLAAAAADALQAASRPVLVLDDLQGVDGAAEAIATLLDRARDVRVLATSRVPLGARAERRWPLEPLGADEAVELFLERSPRPAQADDLPTIRAITASLDGLPLAIELAAARTAVLTFADLARRLDAQRAHVLSGLGAALRDSLAALGRPAREALAQLTVFAGGFSLAAAEAVLDLGGDAPWLPDVLQELVDGQLLRPDDAALRWAVPATVVDHAVGPEHAAAVAAARDRHARRFATLGRGLGGAPTLEAWHDARADRENLLAASRHALAAGDLATAAGAALGWWRTVEDEGPYNAAVALLRDVAERSGDDAVRVALGEALARAGGFAEASDAFGAALGAADPRLRGRARLGRAAAAVQRQQLDAAEAEIALARALGVAELAGRIALAEGTVRQARHQIPDAIDAFEDAVRAAVTAGDPWLEADARAGLGVTLSARCSPEAERQLGLALRLAERIDAPLLVGRVQVARLVDLAGRDPAASIGAHLALADWFAGRGARSRQAWCLLRAADSAMIAGRHDDAEDALDRADRVGVGAMATWRDRLRAVLDVARGSVERGERALRDLLAAARERGDTAQAFIVGTELADVLLRAGRPDEARDLLAEAVGTARAMGRPVQLAEVLIVLARVELARGDAAAAKSIREEAAGIAREAGLERLVDAAEATGRSPA